MIHRDIRRHVENRKGNISEWETWQMGKSDNDRQTERQDRQRDITEVQKGITKADI